MAFYTGFLPAASNRADFMFQVKLTDPKTNDFIDFTGMVITVALRPAARGTQPMLVGSSTDGHVTIIGLGVFEVRFTRQEMTQFPAGEIDLGITLQHTNGVTYQLFSGQVPIVDGVVAA